MSRQTFDVAIIGGGPAGGHTASLIAKAGYKVAIIEEHQTIGQPVQCAGLITPRCFDMVSHARHTVLNELKGAEIFSPSRTIMNIGNDKVQAVAIDRARFDKAIMDKAVDSGATLLQGNRVSAIQIGKPCVISLGEQVIESKLVIGADGAKSQTRKWLGLSEPEYFLNGIGADVSGLDIAQDRVKVFFGNGIAPNFFAWIIPAGEISRVGLCVRDGQGTANDYFKMFFEKGNAASILKGGKILATHSGIIPLGPLQKTFSDRAMLVGDAACQVKATSGGGIYPGLVCAGHCANTAIKALEKDIFTAHQLSAYQKAWSADIGDELKKAMIMHRMFSSLGDKELEEIFGMLANAEMLDIINQTGDIDYPSRLGWMLLKKEPRFLKYTGKFLKYGLIDW
ncbi:MAG: NAD(P)/FAD-dependent oxidoreductase [Thermoplasmata archaeon]|nr:NAD(P)/FAD-dependent oxidoreductase [Thermoplasmata archaeon]